MKSFNVIIFIIILIWVGVFYNRILDYYEFDEILQHNVTNLSLLISEQVNLEIINIDELLQVTIDEMKILPIASTRLLLKNRISKNSYIKEVVFTDAEGTLTYSSIDETKNYKINYSDRIWYKQLKSGDRGLIVSPIVKSKIHGGYTVPFVRGVYNDNVLVGTVILTLDLEYFDKFYKNINVGNYESIFIVGMDGYYRFRRISGEITRVENKKSDIS